jgi:hypothetical protein
LKGEPGGQKEAQTELLVQGEDVSAEDDKERGDEEEEEESEGPLRPGAALLKDVGDEEPSALTSLRMENCGLKSQALEALGKQGFFFSSVEHTLTFW